MVHLKRATQTYLPFIMLVAFLALSEPVGAVLAQSLVTVEVDRTTLSTNEELLLTVRVKGDFSEASYPDLNNLVDFIVTGTGHATQLSLINGERIFQQDFYFQLQPRQEGNLTIPAIGVTVDGQLYQSEPVAVEVLPGPTPTLPIPSSVDSNLPANLNNESYFAVAEVDHANPYVGQQVNYIFKFFHAINEPFYNGWPSYDPPAFINFWGQAILDRPSYSTRINGRDYLVDEIHTAIFPTTPGDITIEPAQLHIPGNLSNSGISLETEPVTLAVRPLPDNPPSEFNGAVGQFEIDANLSHTEATVNEPLTLFIELKGTGNIDLLTEPSLPDLPDWRIFDSQSTSKTQVQDGVIYGRRRFERLIVPSRPGYYEIPPISFTYFDPQTDEYQTVSTNSIPITVVPGEVEVSTADPAAKTLQVAGGDIRHIKPVPSALESGSNLLFASPLFWVIWTLPLIIVAGVWVWQTRRQRFLLDTGYARSQRARRNALKTLSAAGQAGVDGYAMAHRSLLGYLSDKLNRPTVGLTNDELTQILQQQHVKPALIERIKQVLATIEASRFAPFEKTAVQTLIFDTQALVNDLEKVFGGKR